MGGICSTADSHSKQVDRQLLAMEEAYNYTKRFVLLGSGESGKTTIARNLDITFNAGACETERVRYTAYLHDNVCETILILLQKVTEFGLDVSEGSEQDIKDGFGETRPVASRWTTERQRDAQTTLEWAKSMSKRVLLPEQAEAIARLWKTDAVQEAYRRRTQFGSFYYLPGQTRYYMNHVQRFGNFIQQPAGASSDPKTWPGYSEERLPSNDDILKARSRTTGVDTIPLFLDDPEGIRDTSSTTTTLRSADKKKLQSVSKREWSIVDVGGQRCEQEKWMKVVDLFGNFDAVVFVVPIDGIDMPVFDDTKRIPLVDSLDAFDRALETFVPRITKGGKNVPGGKKFPLHLVFNKVDELQQKIDYGVNIAKCVNPHLQLAGEAKKTSPASALKPRKAPSAPMSPASAVHHTTTATPTTTMPPPSSSESKRLTGSTTTGSALSVASSDDLSAKQQLMTIPLYEGDNTVKDFSAFVLRLFQRRLAVYQMTCEEQGKPFDLKWPLTSAEIMSACDRTQVEQFFDRFRRKILGISSGVHVTQGSAVAKTIVHVAPKSRTGSN